MSFPLFKGEIGREHGETKKIKTYKKHRASRTNQDIMYRSLTYISKKRKDDYFSKLAIEMFARRYMKKENR